MKLRSARHFAQSINSRDEQMNFRVCIRFPIRIRFLSGVPLRLVPFAKDFTKSFDTTPPFRENNAAKSAESPQRKPRRAFSDAIRIKDPMFTRTWSSETTATHNARNNGDTALASLQRTRAPSSRQRSTGNMEFYANDTNALGLTNAK